MLYAADASVSCVGLHKLHLNTVWHYDVFQKGAECFRTHSALFACGAVLKVSGASDCIFLLGGTLGDLAV